MIDVLIIVFALTIGGMAVYLSEQIEKRKR